MESLDDIYRQIRNPAKIQVAEQYPYQPHHAARLKLIDMGWLGQIHETHLSTAHGYHALALMRKYLKIGYADVQIIARRINPTVMLGPSRSPESAIGRIAPTAVDYAMIQFSSGETGFYHFTREQYFSPIRKPRLLIRGERGEIENNTARFYDGDLQPCEGILARHESGGEGGLIGLGLERISFGNQVLFENVFKTSRLSDEEIAIAQCLIQMENYLQGGPPFYSLEDALHDTYLSILLEESLQSGKSVSSTGQAWYLDK